MKKRYQYLGPHGELMWTKFFEYNSDYQPKFQLEKHPQLLNEYKDG